MPDNDRRYKEQKGEYQWCGNELYDWNCNLKRYSWQLTVWEKQKIIQALQYNSITVSINHIFALVLRKCHTDYMDDTDFYLQVPSLFNITQIFWSSEDRVKVRFCSVESRQNKPKANHRNLLSTDTRRTRKRLKLKKRPEEGVRVHFRLWFICSDMPLAYITRREL